MFALAVGLAAASLLWIASGRRHPPWIAFLPPALAALLLAASLRPVEPTRPDSGYGQLRITLADIRVAGDTAVSIGGGLADHLIISDPEGTPLPAAAIRLEPVERGIRVVAASGHGRRFIVRVQASSEAPVLLGAKAIAGTVRRCSSLDPIDCGLVDRLVGLRAKASPFVVCPSTGYRRGMVDRPALRRLYAGPDFGWRDAGAPACRPINPDRPLFALSGTGAIHEADPVAGHATLLMDRRFRLVVHELVPAAPVDPALSPVAGRMPVRLDMEVEREASGAIRLRPLREQPFVVARPSGRSRPDIGFAGRDGLSVGSSAEQPVAAFPLLGPRLAAGLLSLSLRIPSGDGAPLSLSGPADAELAGDRLTTGPREARIGFRVERPSFHADPLKPLRTVALVALGLGLLATFRLRARDCTAAVLFGVLDLLLAIRLLIAVEGAVSSPVAASAAYPADAVLALLAVPIALRAAWPAYPGETLPGRSAIMLWSAAIIGAGVAIALHLGPSTPALLGAVVLLVAGCATRLVSAELTRAFSWITATLTASMGKWPRLTTLCLTALIIALRFLIRERIPLPDPLPRLSSALLFLPITMLVAAVLLHLPRTRTSSCALLLFLALGVGVASFAASDSGFAIIAWPIAIAALLAWALEAGAARHRADAAVAAVIALLAVSVLVLSLNGHGLPAAACGLLAAAGMILALHARPSAVWPIPALAILFGAIAVGAAPALPFNNAAIGFADADPGRNMARLYAAFAPSRLEANGNSAAVEFASVLAVMKDYAAGGGWWGQGFLQMPAPVRAIRDTHLSDHAAGVHIFWPHGLAGAAALALLYGAVAVLAAVRARLVTSVGGWVGTQAGLVFSLVSIYMLLANAGWVPFTGRNMFLLSPLSVSDLLEGGLLLGLAAQFLPRPHRPAGRRA